MTSRRRILQRTSSRHVRHRRRARYSHVINTSRNLQLRRQPIRRPRNTVRATLRNAFTRLIPIFTNNGPMDTRVHIRYNRRFHQFRERLITNRVHNKHSTLLNRVFSSHLRHNILISTCRKRTQHNLPSTSLRSQRHIHMLIRHSNGIDTNHKRRSRPIRVTINRQFSTFHLHFLHNSSTRRRLLQFNISNQLSLIRRLHKRQFHNTQGSRTSNFHRITTRHTHHMISKVTRLFNNFTRTTNSVIILTTFTKRRT